MLRNITQRFPYLLHLLLFMVSVITTLAVGAELIHPGKIWGFWNVILVEPLPEELTMGWSDLGSGWLYSLCFLGFLTTHEFGHYFAAVYHRVKTSLPYFIPLYIPIPGIINIGSLGAVIRLRQIPDTTRKYFDIGIAGPLAGFVVSLFLLSYGLATLPDYETYVMGLHPEYEEMFCGLPSDTEMIAWAEDNEIPVYMVGTSLLLEILKDLIPGDPAQVPSHFEIFHYPLLFVGYLTLFFTALNLLPIGQLDGGHVIYGMFGRKNAGYVGRFAVVILLLLGGTGFVDLQSLAGEGGWGELAWLTIYLMFLVYVFTRIIGSRDWRIVALPAFSLFAAQAMVKWYIPEIQPNLIWIIYSILAIRLIGIDHPPALSEHPLDTGRKVLGWLAILIFILCFTPEPIRVVGLTG